MVRVIRIAARSRIHQPEALQQRVGFDILKSPSESGDGTDCIPTSVYVAQKLSILKCGDPNMVASRLCSFVRKLYPSSAAEALRRLVASTGFPSFEPAPSSLLTLPGCSSTVGYSISPQQSRTLGRSQMVPSTSTTVPTSQLASQGSPSQIIYSEDSGGTGLQAQLTCESSEPVSDVNMQNTHEIITRLPLPRSLGDLPVLSSACVTNRDTPYEAHQPHSQMPNILYSDSTDQKIRALYGLSSSPRMPRQPGQQTGLESSIKLVDSEFREEDTQRVITLTRGADCSLPGQLSPVRAESITGACPCGSRHPITEAGAFSSSQKIRAHATSSCQGPSRISAGKEVWSPGSWILRETKGKEAVKASGGCTPWLTSHQTRNMSPLLSGNGAGAEETGDLTSKYRLV
ncbi:unnamed protein product [Protopolystoma xenopodis]|uniref:Uncharacterized protein n=1 Tax=Protopolystoma xenopodis TaxID=117903 RepID=A0A3S5AXF5_9PLAT|nr:unnamed protein product [Protopolystoma xenopodis]